MLSLRTIAVCGGGSLAHVLTAVAGAEPSRTVRVLTRRPDEWSSEVHAEYGDLELIGRVDHASSDPAEVIPGADAVLIAVPFNAREEVLWRIAPYMSPESWIGSFPGFGGFDWLARSILGPDAALFGTQRVPFVCHKLEYGRRVAVTGIRPQTLIATLPSICAPTLAEALEELLNVPVRPVPNYLCVTLSPSNSIYHPARIFTFFRDWRVGILYPDRPLFYEDWDDAATDTYLGLSEETQAICRAVPLDMASVLPLFPLYGVSERKGLTKRIRAIGALSGRPMPLRRENGGFVPDLQTYYFTEDLPYGVVVLRGVAEAAGVETPLIDAVIRWSERILGHRYFGDDGRVTGSDAAGLPLPSRFGIATRDELVRRALC
jgi:opine dehydrogenase